MAKTRILIEIIYERRLFGNTIVFDNSLSVL